MSKIFCFACLWATASALMSCFASPAVTPTPSIAPAPSPVAVAPALNPEDLLQASWQAYKQRFIQADGRVIDREANDRTVSEGQAYAMLRAVLIDDPDTFDRTLQWAENNLRRSDSLWAWKWGQNDQGWGILDENFASDGDLDAITALILADRRWNRPEYLALARAKLNDLWQYSTLEVPQSDQQASMRYFLPGPTDAFVQPDRVYLNPSYLAPAAFRLFAQVDRHHDWLSLVNSSYAVLNDAAGISEVGLPSDWVQLNRSTGELAPIDASNPTLQSLYAFDAFRVWWRVALDAAWFNSPQAKDFLQTHLPVVQATWSARQSIPARVNLQGDAIVPYESTAQYAMLYAAFSITDPAVAEQIWQQKLLTTYRDGFWDSDSAYYTQNLAWFGLSFPNRNIFTWLQP